MYSFLISMAALVLGYLFYGKFLAGVFGADSNRTTPAISHADGVDYVPMPAWKIYMIQFLNIAGTGPIFGAIMGAKFGPASYLWIVFGCIFAGAVHDYLSGMISLRYGGASLPDIIGRNLGKTTKYIVLLFSVILLLLVGAVFVYSPAQILGDMTEGMTGSATTSALVWGGVIFVYYLIATLMPIDKIIGKIYPLFAFALIFMVVALMGGLLVKWPDIPEIWQGLGNRSAELGVAGQDIFPCLFITVACGAISGFHATQSPMMARCITNEKLGRPIFYGAMITEGAVALIWAAVASYFFFDGGAAETGSSISASAPQVVTAVSKSWLGVLGSILALLGVVAAPITSGDTALRSARLIIAELLHIRQHSKTSRLAISIPIFAAVALLLWYNMADANGFNNIWRYFGWANQTLAVFTLWTLTAYLVKNKKGAYFIITLLPACFMTAVCLSFICTQPIGLGMPQSWTPYIAAGSAAAGLALFCAWYYGRSKKLKCTLP